jgi:hypothetical protein
LSYTTINQAANDAELQARIIACIAKEATQGEIGDTPTGLLVRTDPAQGLTFVLWPIAVDNEEPYEYAVNSGNEHPGADEGVITDAAILAGVQTHWPKPPPEPEHPPVPPEIEPLPYDPPSEVEAHE